MTVGKMWVPWLNQLRASLKGKLLCYFPVFLFQPCSMLGNTWRTALWRHTQLFYLGAYVRRVR